jgi:acyl transferase domain-containing protein/NAD(P)H-dependent flavin oxidoreductase YrpB (nitropropane dioxygenase family)/NAD(P)-dependent dehydrogenase (short-subunit alcohol dehydrogenase family)
MVEKKTKKTRMTRVSGEAPEADLSNLRRRPDLPETILRSRRDLVLGVSPFGEPNARLVAAVARAGGLGVLDLGDFDRRGREALTLVGRWAPGPLAVRLGANCGLSPAELLSAIDRAGTDVETVVLGVDSLRRMPDVVDRYRILVEVISRDEGLLGARYGAHGLIARGSETGGRVGELSSFVLLQQLLSEHGSDLPVWVWGGIGLRTAAAAVMGGAAGVVLDTQLSLLAEADTPYEIARAIRAMDGSETVTVDGHRVFRRRRAKPTRLAAQSEAGVVEPLGTQDLRIELPIGQDAFLAARFADKFGNVARAVRAVRETILDEVRDGSAGSALRPGSPGSRALRTELPIVQGPMTRVSDQARFAAAVSDEGGLPFIALALSGPEQTRALLQQTLESLDGRPWGVGILGFVPEATKAAQLEIIRELRPAYAIIAGGRPQQAEALEDAGVETFLHVPSPVLLRQFLEAGARKFVFEGAECGGHVGPRNSFPLWEAQVGVLTDYLEAADRRKAGEFKVLFAGGVHDERSAAMVAALAGPLIASDVAVGLVVGTGYLFTEQAVSRGAVQPLFQRQVVTARRTALLETAPGHATRCVESPFTESFRDIKHALQAAGTSDRQLWEKLELLNVGRLRIATKGIERADDGLAAVDEERQLAEGLFMAGQVAVLRSELTTIRSVHESVSTGAAEFLAERTEHLRRELEVTHSAVATNGARPPPPPLDIAIVGMSCIFAQAQDMSSFWANVLSGVDAITEVPRERWDPNIYYSPEAVGTKAGQGTPSKQGGFLPQIPFDPIRFGIQPASLASIEPVQLLALEVAQRALSDAGYGERDFNRARASVVFGAEAGSELAATLVLRSMLPAYCGTLPAELDEELPTLTGDSFPGLLSNVIAGRIANRLDLGGANYVVDAACASSLAALDVACKDLVNGASDIVLCGGADLHNGINDYLLFSSVQALSPSGRPRPFDATADGLILGEGVACVVLKRLADAERDGDRVYAVIKGIGSASDGRSLGLVAPHPEGQRLALERAYRNAAIQLGRVGLIEAHGTGTVVGDRAELAALGALFKEGGAAPGSCALGSVKSQIGHTKCAAGLAGLIKIAMALHTGVLPPTANLEHPNRAWQAETSPFVFDKAARPWAATPADRVAGVSAFGFGGTNFHAVLEGYDGGPPRHGVDVWPVELFTFSGADRQAAYRAIEELLELLSVNEHHGRPWTLRDLALTASRRSEGSEDEVRIALLATDLDNLSRSLRGALEGTLEPSEPVFLADAGGTNGEAGMKIAGDLAGGKVAVLFPGQGSQRPGMLAELFVAFPELQRHLHAGQPWANAMFPPAAFDDKTASDQTSAIADTRVAQPALGIAGLAVYELFAAAGIRPDMLAGHSYGELVALCAAGALDSTTLLDLSAERAEAILAAAGDDPGAMAAVAATVDEVDEVLTAESLDQVVVANHNAPRQTVIAGPTTRTTTAVERLRAAGHHVTRIPVACAFHSPVVSGAGARFAKVLAKRRVEAPEVPVWSNRTACAYPTKPDEVRAELVAQLGSPVRFVDEIESMYSTGARVFIEAGPGSILTGFVTAVLGERPHLAVACEKRRGEALRGFLEALAQLAVHGVRLRTDWLFTGRNATDLSGAGGPKPPRWTVDGHLVRTAEGGFLPGGLRPARRLVQLPATQATPSGANDRDGERDALIVEFLRTSREMLAAQRDVLLTYFGGMPDDAAHAPGGPVAQDLPSLSTVADSAPRGATEPAVAASIQAQPALQKTEGPPTREQMTEIVREIVSQRTGYPTEMIEPNLDLEADLSIDSIKRAEIAGELLSAVDADPAQLGEADLEDLFSARTAFAIADWLTIRFGASAHTGEHHPGSSTASPTALTQINGRPMRFVWRGTALDDGAPTDRSEGSAALAGKKLILLGDRGGLADSLSQRLTEHGASALVLEATHILTEADGPVDGVIYAGAIADSDTPILPQCFPVLKAAMSCNPKWFVAVSFGGSAEPSSPADRNAAGLRGLVRAVAREYPEMTAKLVEVDRSEGSATIADSLIAELRSEDRVPVVQRSAAYRRGLELAESDLRPLGSSDGDSTDGRAAEASAIGLDRESVVLLIGGARGITARCALALAACTECRMELAGSTPLPDGQEDPSTASALDPAALRAALVAQGFDSVPEIEARLRRILAQREIADTIDELRGVGAKVRYQPLDVRDDDAVRELVTDVHARNGRLDGVVYGAGVTVDKLLKDTSVEAFERVFNTKAIGARALLEAISVLPNPPRFTVLFGSIAAVLGSRGQVGYSAANDALQTLGEHSAAQPSGRVLTVHWAPWAPCGKHPGIVSPELHQEWSRRGFELIHPEEGPLCLLRELAWGDRSVDSVVYAPPGWIAT